MFALVKPKTTTPAIVIMVIAAVLRSSLPKAVTPLL